MTELRITDTNSANDSRGRAFGLDGNDFIYVLVAFVLALGLYIAFAFLLRTGMMVALVFALPVFLVPLAWVVFLRHNKPDGYSEDLLDDIVNGEGWTLAKDGQTRPPGKESHAQ